MAFRRWDESEVTERKCSLVIDVQAAALVCQNDVQAAALVCQNDVQAAALVCQKQHRWRDLMVLATACRLVECTSSVSRLEEVRSVEGRSVRVRRISSARVVLRFVACGNPQQTL